MEEQRTPSRTVQAATWVLLGLQCLALVVVVALSGKHELSYDEPFFVGMLEDRDRLGWSAEFVRGVKVAVPPLYAGVHQVLGPVFGREVPGIRLVNVALGFLCIAELGWVLRRCGVRDAWLLAGGMLGLPTFFVVAGMALTEVPAMVFLIPGIGLSLAALEGSGRRAMGLAVCGGVLLGLACLGRQTYLVVTAGLVAVAWVRRSREAVGTCAICVGLPVAMMMPVFWMWEGLAPPSQRVLGMGGSVEPVQGLLGLAYGGLTMVLLAPRFLRVRWKVAAVLVVASVVLAALFWPGEFKPAVGLVRRVLPEAMVPFYGRAAAAGFTALAVFFAWGCVRTCVRPGRTAMELFAAVAAVLLCLAPVMVPHTFSGRYIAMAFPLLVMLSVAWGPVTWWRVGRLAAGTLAGVTMLSTYYGTQVGN